MFKRASLRLLSAATLLGMLAACAGPAQQLTDYTAFKKSQPRSILVLPPVNETPDVKASYGMLSQMTKPLAESGYYVIPVGLMDETFKQNGLTTASNMQEIAPAKLRQIFGADAALYTTVTKYGSVYQVVDSTTIVSASAKLVDLRTGDVLWHGVGSANGNEVGGNVDVNAFGLVGALVQAAVKQVAHSLSDDSVAVAGLTSRRMLSAGPPNGLLYGPYSPKYGTD